MLMNSKRADPICVPLRDGRIFICGGTSEHKCWVEFYDPKTRKFEGKDLPDCYLYPHPSSCFQWNQQVMIYYDICYDNKEQYDNQYVGLLDKNNPTLLSYDMGTDKWDVIVENLPRQLYDIHERNLVYVGGDILFIIDDAYCWFVYNLSSREKVGEVKVQSEADCPDEGVTGAFYVGNNDIESTSWVIYLFRAHTYHDPSTLRYVKVQVVQGEGGGYIATVLMSGDLILSPYTFSFIIANKVSRKIPAKMSSWKRPAKVSCRKRPAKVSSRKSEDLLKEKEKEKEKGKGKEKMMRSE